MTKLFAKYTELREDIKVNGFDNNDKFKKQLGDEMERCFSAYGEKKVIKEYRKMVENY